MLVVGGRNSLSGAVVGALFISTVSEGLKRLEAGPTSAAHVPSGRGCRRWALRSRCSDTASFGPWDHRRGRGSACSTSAGPVHGVEPGREEQNSSPGAVSRPERDAPERLRGTARRRFRRPAGSDGRQPRLLDRGEILGLIGPNGAPARPRSSTSSQASSARRTGRVFLGGARHHRRAAAQAGAPKASARTFQSVRAVRPHDRVRERARRSGGRGGLGSGRRARRRGRSLRAHEPRRRQPDARPGAPFPHGEERRLGIIRALAVRPAIPVSRRAGGRPRTRPRPTRSSARCSTLPEPVRPRAAR